MSYDPIDDAQAQRYELSLDEAKQRIATLESEVAALRAEVEGMRENAERYATVRRMHVEQFARIFKRNLQENIPFDDLIDVWRKESNNG